jgi:putative flippase GtrA
VLPTSEPTRWYARMSRSTATSLFTTVLDFGTLVLLVNIFHLNYVLATWIGTVVGSLSNFTINKHWAFRDSKVGMHNQFGRFLAVQAGSSGLNTLGVYLFTHFLGVDYKLSRIIVAAMVALGWNYPMNHALVFATRRRRGPSA